MSSKKPRRISGAFTTLAANVACLFGAGCAHNPWQGEEGLGHDPVYEPRLDHTSYLIDPVDTEPANDRQLQGAILKIDRLLHGRDKFSTERISYNSSDGSEGTAYLTIPDTEGPHPVVVMFPVLSEQQSVSELAARHLTRKGFAVMRLTNHPVEFVDTDDASVPMTAYQHAILDARLLIDWMQAERADLDGNKIAAAGISLGSLLSSTLMGVEPDIRSGAFILSGGGLADILHDSENKNVAAFRERVMERQGLETREDFLEHVSEFTTPVDPLRYAGSLDPCRVIMITGRFDTEVPAANAELLWQELGQPDWRTMPTKHKNIGGIFYWIMNRVADHFDEVLRDDVCERPPAQDILTAQAQNKPPGQG